MTQQLWAPAHQRKLRIARVTWFAIGIVTGLAISVIIATISC
jgi:hypothetical protein